MQGRFETFTVLINRISRNIRKIKNQEMAEYKLKSVHVSCIYYIYTHKGATATDLRELCEEDKATVSRALKYLEKNGFLTREAGRLRKYKRPLALTEKGKEAGEKIAGKIGGALQSIGSELTQEEREDFYRSLSIISEGLDAASKKRGAIL